MIAAAVDKLERGIKNSPAHLSRFCATRGFPLTAQLLSRVDVDAPLTLSFLLLCCLVQLLKVTLGDTFVYLYFAVPSWSLFRVRSLRCWATLVTQVLGHTSWEHLFGNVSLLLLTGPTNERAFGMHVMMKIMLVTAITSSAAHVVLGASHTLQLGASGIVFMQILLSSLIEVKHGRVPLTFLVQVMLWCYKEVTLLLLGPSDGVSHIAHISGAICGVAAGYAHVDTTEYKKREEIMQSMSVVGDLPTPYNVFASQKNS